MKKENIVVTLLLTLGIISLTIGVSIAFFNYTRTGSENVLAVGRIYFTSSQGTSINLTNVFPVKSTELENNPNVGSVTLTITGDTTYDEGLEYLISADQVVNTINNKHIPIGVDVTATNLGTSDTDYFDNHGGNSSLYKVLAKDTIKEDGELVVGYITKGATGVNGSVTIKAFIDADKIAITDTPDENSEWQQGREVFSTAEWNSFNSNGLTFKLRIEANEGIWVEDTNAVAKVRKAITAKINAETNSCNPILVDNNGTANDETDDITYFSGTNDCVDMNYVWYSGKLWRITAIYPDGAMKLVTQNNITSIAFNESGQVNFYTDENTTSYMYQWLNEDFYDTLYNVSEFIDTTKLWNATMPADNLNGTKPAETNMVSANVGLLNSYEYYNARRNDYSSTNYLNIGYYWALINPYDNSDSSKKIWVASDTGSYIGNGTNYPDATWGTRPSIYLKSEIEFTGDGTRIRPYRIVGDREIGNASDLLNTRLSGEYVKLKNGNNEQIFRIIGVEENKTKIIAMDYADNSSSRKFATSATTLWGDGTTTDTDTWYDYLNSTYFPYLKSTYGELFDSSLYYLGVSGYNYKLSVCDDMTSGNIKVCNKTTRRGTFDIGLPRYGEMFATQQSGGRFNSISMWLMNGKVSGKVWHLWYSAHNNTDWSPNNEAGARPTVHLKSTVKILSGSGTEDDPYVVGL